MVIAVPSLASPKNTDPQTALDSLARFVNLRRLRARSGGERAVERSI
jgi:hypothetical protein